MEGPLVMVVDDDLDVRESLAGLLREEGYRVLCAAHGQDALALLATGELPKLILLDWMMPVMSGGEFRKVQLEMPRLSQIPTVLITAGVPQLSSHLAFEEVMPKPLRIERLLALVDRHAPVS